MQKSCFLFGNADTPKSILPSLEQAIEEEYSKGITVFYVGHHGDFDQLAATALRAVKRRYSEITLMLVLAYHPAERAVELPLGFDGSFYPPLENIPRRYAIVRANQYMVKSVDSIICCVRHYGNAEKLLEYAHTQVSEERLFINRLES